MANAGFGDLVQALDAAGLTSTVEGASAATVLAPTDAALAAPLADGSLFGSLTPAEQADVLTYHVLAASLGTAALQGATGTGLGEVDTLDGRQVFIERLGTQLYANDLPLEPVGIKTQNGFVHRLDSVLLPPADDLIATLNERGYTIFAAVLANLGVAAVLQDPTAEYTLLAPSDAALLSLVGTQTLDELLAPENAEQLLELVLYHSAPGKASAAAGLEAGSVASSQGPALFFRPEGNGLRVSGALVETINVPGGKGVLHGIDRLLGTDTVAGSVSGYDLDLASVAISAADLSAALSDLNAKATLFAPTDGAFEALPSGQLDLLIANGPAGDLPGLLTYHAVAGKLDSQALLVAGQQASLQGGDLIVEQIGATTYVNDAKVVDADLPASSGYVHRIDRVLSVPTDIYSTLEARGLDTLVAAIDATGAKALFDGSQATARTVFAPTEAAFEALPPGLLNCLLDGSQAANLQTLVLNHVANSKQTAAGALGAGSLTPVAGPAIDVTLGAGDVVLVNGVAISSVNVACTNGVVHVIDAVILDGYQQLVPDNVTELVQGLPVSGYGAIKGVLEQTGLDVTLATPGPFTFFAPDDIAYIDLATDLGLMFTDLQEPAYDDYMTEVMKYHVVVGEFLCAADLLAAGSVTTLGGEVLNITDNGVGGLTIGTEAGVVVANLLASNGVVHLIDRVLVPSTAVLPQLTVADQEEGAGSTGADEAGFSGAAMMALGSSGRAGMVTPLVGIGASSTARAIADGGSGSLALAAASQWRGRNDGASLLADGPTAALVLIDEPAQVMGARLILASGEALEPAMVFVLEWTPSTPSTSGDSTTGSIPQSPSIDRWCAVWPLTQDATRLLFLPPTDAADGLETGATSAAPEVFAISF
ncbi:fasciclin domain-containing protein [Engelhardtia mirabilis]|uniref:fasciclin domain-containing protein n=1 Tax=Engelhardtia mirabilis TaxID=2528011 RepID=UPI003AF3632C